MTKSIGGPDRTPPELSKAAAQADEMTAQDQDLVDDKADKTGKEQGKENSKVRRRARRSRKRRLPPVTLPPAIAKVVKMRRFQVVSAIVVVSGVVVGGLAYGRQQMIAALPDPNGALTFARRGTLTIKSADGQVLQKLGPSTREDVPLSKLPDQVIKAFIAAEDRRFYKHDGVDYQSIARAVRANLTAQGVVEGGSTITQQLARIAFLDQDRTLQRKLREALMAQKLEHELGKDKILERYLNLVYLGSGAYGVADAAWIYFGKTPDKLTLSEAATIAGVPPAPSAYSPLENPDLAKERRGIVLQRMVREGFISQAEADQANASELKTNSQIPKYFNSQSPYFTTYIQKELSKFLSKEEIEAGGLTVETSLNLKWQDHASQMVVDFVNNEGYYQGFEQAAMAIIDPKTGQIKVMVGGADFKDSQFNRVTQAQRQPGSTFKTFVYTAGIAAGFSPYDVYNDVPLEVDGYKPKNYGGKHAGSMNMIRALSSSVNIIALRVLLDAGFKPTINMARAMGIESKLEPTYSMALGAWEVNLLELTSAYGTLANKGEHVQPHGIVKVVDRTGKVLVDGSKEYKAKKAVDPGTASIMTWMLEQVVEAGTGGPAYLSDRQVAGKTGTSEKARDLWFVGYIPQLVAGVWLGNDDNYPTGGTSGTAASLWHEVMKEITADLDVEKFPNLPNLDTRKGSIKAEPINPNSFIEGRYDPEPKRSYSDNSDDGYSNDSYAEDPYYDNNNSTDNYYDSKPEPEPYYEPEPEPYYEPEPEPYYEPEPQPEPAYEAPPPEPAYEEPPPPPPPPPLPDATSGQ